MKISQNRQIICSLFFLLSAFLQIALVNCGSCGETVRNTQFRGSYGNSQLVFQNTGKGRVAFMGGSITEMEGYRPMVCEYLQKKFANTEFEFIAAGISSTCSDTGAFRLESDVLSKGPIDLFFLEFAVNDNQDGFFSEEHSLRGFEGIVRHIRSVYPNVDIVVTFFVNESLMQDYRASKVPASISAHTKVAEKYNISTIDLCKEVQERIDAGTLTWAEFGGVHPAPTGNRICTDMIESVLNYAWSNSGDAKASDKLVPHSLPEQIDPFSYTNGAFFDMKAVNKGSFGYFAPEWKNIAGGFRGRFAGLNLLCAEKPGDSFSFTFDGTAVGLYVLAGPDAGNVDFSIDGSEYKTLPLIHAYSSGLHYPRTVVLADTLKPGKHDVTLRVSGQRNPQSKGTAVRILEICVQKSK